jgi:hypothetical protein
MFEKYVMKCVHNLDYFYSYMENGQKNTYLNYDGYYKGRTVNRDIKDYQFSTYNSFSEASITELT